MKRWVIFTPEEARAFVSVPRPKRWWAIDCETDGIDPKEDPAPGPKGRIVCFSLASSTDEAFVWLTPEIADVFRPWLRNLPVVAHNFHSFDWHMFRKAGLPLCGPVFDTLRAHRLLRTEEGVEHGLKVLAKWWVPEVPMPGEFKDLFTRRQAKLETTGLLVLRKVRVAGRKVNTIFGTEYSRLLKGRTQVTLADIPALYPHLLPLLIEYSIVDSAVALKLAEKLMERLKNTCIQPYKPCIPTSLNQPTVPYEPSKPEESTSTSTPTPKPATKLRTVSLKRGSAGIASPPA